MSVSPSAPPFALARTTAKSAATRATIVRGALQALEAHGIAGTTTRRIAAEAGVRLATLHYHFADKESLLLAVLDALVAELTQTLTDEAPRAATFDEQIAHVVRTAWHYAERTRAKQIVQFELTLYALRTRGAAWLAERQYGDYVAVYSKRLMEGTDTPLPPERAEALARFILASIDGMILQALAGMGGREAHQAVEALIAAARERARALDAAAAKPAKGRTARRGAPAS